MLRKSLIITLPGSASPGRARLRPTAGLRRGAGSVCLKRTKTRTSSKTSVRSSSLRLEAECVPLRHVRLQAAAIEDADRLVGFERRARLDVEQRMLAAERLDFGLRDFDEVGARHDVLERRAESRRPPRDRRRAARSGADRSARTRRRCPSARSARRRNRGENRRRGSRRGCGSRDLLLAGMPCSARVAIRSGFEDRDEAVCPSAVRLRYLRACDFRRPSGTLHPIGASENGRSAVKVSIANRFSPSMGLRQAPR